MVEKLLITIASHEPIDVFDVGIFQGQLRPLDQHMVRKMDQDLAGQGHRLDPADGFHEDYFGGVVRHSSDSLQSVEEPGNQAQWHTSPGSIDQQEVTPVEPFPEAEGEIQGHQGGPNGRRPRLLDLPGPGKPDHLVIIRVLVRGGGGGQLFQAEVVRLGEDECPRTVLCGVRGGEEAEHLGGVAAGAKDHGGGALTLFGILSAIGLFPAQRSSHHPE